MYRPLTALSLALALTGCTAPDSVDSPSADAFSEAGQEPTISAAPFVFEGQIRTAEGEPLPQASVCIYGGDTCASTADDGGFSLPGLEAGVGEVVRIEATGYAPLLVPVDRDRYDGIGLELNPLPTKVPMPEGTGVVQFITSRVTAAGHVHDMLPNWTITAESGKVRRTEGSRPIVIDMDPGVYEARYEVDGLCAELSGWAGPNGHTLSFPIEAGAVTQIHQLCVR